ncbi:MAG: nucleotide exchange factor GrpE [Magnetococcales bacterium]|nr:nucleotide exchange factor GrpE [Magnetococcales bacterium]
MSKKSPEPPVESVEELSGDEEFTDNTAGDDAGQTPADDDASREGYLSPMEMLIQAQAKAEEYRNDYLRAVADMRNLRQRTDREMQNARQYAVEAFAKDLLQIADNLERALAAVPAGDDPAITAITDGVRMVATGLDNTFKRHGVTRIQALSAPFDPNLHQAVMQVEDGSVPPGTVVRELQSGYLLNNRLLRPSMVGVSLQPAEVENSSPPDS